MILNGRLILLLVAMGLFVRVWSANDRPRQRPVPRSRSQAASTSSLPLDSRPEPAISGESAGAMALFRVAAHEELWTAASCPVPLPAGLTSGVYRVVDDLGRVARLEIGPAAAVSPTSISSPSPSFFVTAAADRQWYFIRLQGIAGLPSLAGPRQNRTSPVGPATEPHPQPIARRKFDFSGYIP